MDRKGKELVSCIALAASLLSLLALMVLYPTAPLSAFPVLGTATLIVVSVFVASAIAAIHYSATGGRVEGSTLDWFAAGIVSPFGALLLSLFGHRKGKNREAIDIDDRRRLDKL